MTPLEIDLLLHIHCRPLWYDHRDAPAVQEAIEGFLADELIAKDSPYEGPDYHPYRLTSRGSAMVFALCSVEYPVSCWRLPGTSTVLC